MTATGDETPVGAIEQVLIPASPADRYGRKDALAVSVEPPMTQRNPYLCLAIVIAIATVALVATIGLVICAAMSRAVPESLVAIASASVGALSGALSVSGQIRTLTAPGR
jgi:hypothetical protein